MNNRFSFSKAMLAVVLIVTALAIVTAVSMTSVNRPKANGLTIRDTPDSSQFVVESTNLADESQTEMNNLSTQSKSSESSKSSSGSGRSSSGSGGSVSSVQSPENETSNTDSDNLSPVISLSQSASVIEWNGQIVFGWNVSDDSTLNSEFSVINPKGAVAYSSNENEGTVSLEATELYYAGDYSVTFNSEDSYGNSNSTSSTFIINPWKSTPSNNSSQNQSSQNQSSNQTETPSPSDSPSDDLSFGSLVGFWNLNGNSQSALGSDSGNTHGNVNYVQGKLGQAAHFDGSSYIEIADRDYFSPSTFGQHMTVSFWMKPDTYDFAGENMDGYVHFLGKQEWNSAPNYEWVFRLYNRTAWDEFPRPARTSMYVFNKGGGLGAASELTGAAPLGQWTHIVGEIDGEYTKFYVNGKLVDKDPVSEYDIHMSNGNSPLRIGTADMDSFYKGSIDELRIYNRALSDSEVNQLYLG
jgi:hypothetical protein